MEEKPITTKRYYNLDLDEVFKLLKEKFGIKGKSFQEIELDGADYVRVDVNKGEFYFATYEGEE